MLRQCIRRAFVYAAVVFYDCPLKWSMVMFSHILSWCLDWVVALKSVGCPSCWSQSALGRLVAHWLARPFAYSQAPVREGGPCLCPRELR